MHSCAGRVLHRPPDVAHTTSMSIFWPRLDQGWADLMSDHIIVRRHAKYPKGM